MSGERPLEELLLAQQLVTDAVKPLLMSSEVPPQAMLVALVDIIGLVVAGARQAGAINDKDVSDLKERFSVRIAERPSGKAGAH